MNKTLFNRFVLSLGRRTKSLILVIFDLVALTLALWSAFALRLSEWWPIGYMEPAGLLFLAIPVLGVLIFLKLGLYRAVVRFFSGQAVIAVCKGVGLVTLLMYGLASWIGIAPFPRSVPINFALASLLYVGGSRLFVRHYYHWLLDRTSKDKSVIIYGAGSAGVQLATALEKSAEYHVHAFVDDDPTLWGRNIKGISVYAETELSELILLANASQVLVAIPSLSNQQRKTLLNHLAKYPVKVKVMPSMPDIVAGEKLELREVEIEDLLGRNPVVPMQNLLDYSLKEKHVLVTGAGGSIGSELARQAVEQGAETLVLYEISEFALYTIEAELKQCKVGSKVSVIPILGSVLDKDRLKDVIDKFNIQTIYHAAAYKHVPLVEHNVAEGIKNNIIGTRNAALAALEQKVERFVLISTDKAVRPTNVMGATKRAAEIVLQNLNDKSSSTIFSMVRFGNVLGSSGSVVPLFSKQIKAGGPVTVTHKDINRYFMTIPEAASLVIQAGSMAKGGEVFVLDMGEVVKIADLAKNMISLMGHSVRSEVNPSGDIAIQYTGLRPGEKLYEELLIGDNVRGTDHPKIMMANEGHISSKDMDRLINEMVDTVRFGDSGRLRELLKALVDEYHTLHSDVDWLSSVTDKPSIKLVGR